MLAEIQRFLKYKDLFYIFVWRNLSIRYRQSLFGIAWAVFQPLSLMVLFSFVFTHVLPTRVSEFPYPVFFLAGLLFWNFFASSVTNAIPVIVTHYNLVTKVYFPREILPFSAIVTALVDLGITLIIFGGMLVFYRIPLTMEVFWFIPLFLVLFMVTMAVSLVLSALNVYYRDVGILTNFLIQLWFFMTPVFYSTDQIPGKWKIVFFINPLTFPIENLRRVLVEGRGVVPWQYVLALVGSVLLLWASYKFFRITEKKFADAI